MADFDGWETLKKLGEGGQGDVFLARSPQARQLRAEKIGEIITTLPYLSQPGGVATADKLALRLAEAIREMPDASSGIGALKVFKFGQGDHARDAQKRLDTEVRALEEMQGSPSILRLLHANQVRGFLVTEYHAGGTLAGQPGRFVGDLVLAVEAFRPLVEAVASLHAKGIVHRDIKPHNIFVGADGRLVLGDFGIVFLASNGERATHTFENVGSWTWMPPWAMNERIDEPDFAFDVFALGKVLWTMISGKPHFPLWYFKRPGNDLENLFPTDRRMQVVNELLSKCVVENKSDCLPSAVGLLEEVDALLRSFRGQGDRLRESGGWPCRVCGVGHYEPKALGDDPSRFDRLVAAPALERQGRVSSLLAMYNPWVTALPVRLFVCDHCGHVELFERTIATKEDPVRRVRPAWIVSVGGETKSS